MDFLFRDIPVHALMPKSTQLLKSSVLLTSGQVLSYGLSFIRNLILARMLAKADYGLAAVFAMAMMLLEISGRMSFGTQVIQSKQGGTPGFQASAHALQFFGGLCSAALLVTLSVPMARLFDVPHTWWAFAVLAIVPLSQGLAHLDIARRQRELDFIPLVLMDLVPQVITTLAIWPLAVWLQDYRAILWVIVGKAVLGTLISFGFAQWPYRWGWDQVHIRSMLIFGWPLLLNGLVMFGSQQADQVLVGAVFSLDVLANFALAFSLVSIPWFIFGQVLSSVMLPIMSRSQDDPVRLRHQYRICAQVASVGGVICLVPLIVSGEQLIILFYGSKYHGCGIFMALLGAAAIMRFLRFAPAVAALAKGDTLNQLYSNVWRSASIPLALIVWSAGGTSEQIAGCALAGEALAAVVSMVLLQKRQDVPLSESLGASLFVIIWISASLLVFFLLGARLSFGSACLLATGASAISLIVAWLLFPATARFMIESMQKKSGGLASRPSSS